MTRQRKISPRKTAVEILNRIDREGAYAEPLLDSVLAGNGAANLADRRLLTQLVYGTLRNRSRLDWIIGLLYRGKAEAMDHSLRNILRIGLYQLLFTDRIPPFAAVNEAVKTAKAMHPAGAGLVNAVLRKFLKPGTSVAYPDKEKDPAGYVSVFHSHPLWLVEKWIGTMGFAETLELCKADNETPPLTIRVNRLKADREETGKALAGEGCEAQAADLSPEGLKISALPVPVRELRLFREGRFVIQDEASQLVSHLVDPRPGEKVLDLCAGTGVKTTHLAELMGNQGHIAALDINAKKLDSLRGLAQKLGITIIHSLAGDARAEPSADFREAFDRVLVDAPCSGLGTLRRNPEIKWRLTPESLREFPPLQADILANAARFLKRGGILVYSTCTISAEENGEVLWAFLSGNRDFTLVHPSGSVDRRVVDQEGFFRTAPHRHGTDGFFGAVLRKG